MRGRYPAPSGLSYSFGPGGISPGSSIRILANLAVFVLSWLAPQVILWLGLVPADVVGQLRVWQLVTYMFVHAGVGHILFNMLALWMFGVELERMWGTRFFLKYYFACGLGAAATTMVLPLLPFPMFDGMYSAITMGASGAIYGILLAYGLYFPNRLSYIYCESRVPTKDFVMIMSGSARRKSMGSTSGDSTAHRAHLAVLVMGYLSLKCTRHNLLSVMQYRFLNWLINRM